MGEIEIFNTVVQKHNVNFLLEPLLLAYICQYNSYDILHVEKRVNQLNNLAGKTDIGNTKEGIEFIAVSHVYFHKLKKGSEEKCQPSDI